MSGRVKLHRSLLEWEWYHDINVCRVFIHLLLTANFEEKKFKEQILPPGTILTTWPELCEATGLSVQQARTAINKLKSTGNLTVRTTNKYSLVTIENYNKYQDKETDNNRQDDSQNNIPVTDKQQTNGDTFKRIQECNNLNNIYINNQPDIFAEGQETASPKKVYVFEGDVIHLTKKDYADWEKAFPNLNLYSELTARDSWLSGQSESVRKNWFISTSKYFANINKKNMSEDLSAKAENLRIANVNKWIAANISSDIEAVLAKIKKVVWVRYNRDMTVEDLEQIKSWGGFDDIINEQRANGGERYE